MTQINTTTTTLPAGQPSTFSKISSQAKETLTWAKDGLSSAAVSGYTTGKKGLQYLGVKSVELYKASPQMARDAYTQASTAAKTYYNQRPTYDMALDLAKVAVGSFAAYKAISFGPTNLANLVGRALYLPFEYADHLAAQNSFLNPMNMFCSLVGGSLLLAAGTLVIMAIKAD